MSGWSRIDSVELHNSPYLEAEDECYYLLERSRGTYLAGHANDVVNNFQKDIERFGARPEVMKYKDRAIRDFAASLAALLVPGAVYAPWVIVPMITSKPKCHPFYDDRLLRAAEHAGNLGSGKIVVADLFDLDEELLKAKCGGPRNPTELLKHIIIDASLLRQPDNIVLIDDVLTSGGHFAACKQAIKDIYPNAHIIGAFLARQITRTEYEVITF